MLSRRSLLISASAFAFGQLLMGCGTSDAAVKIRLLEDSVPPQLLKAFQQQMKGTAIDFSQSEQLADLFKLLQVWKQQDGKAAGSSLPFVGSKAAPLMDLVTLGDYWLTPAIQQKLIQPLPLAEIPAWQQLPPQWRQFVQRDRQGNLNETGELWAAPYRWGTLMMAYRVDAFRSLGWTPTDWQDLWRPELKHQISLPDSARAVIGLTLKKMKQSVNEAGLPADLESELRSLHQQTKFYSSNAYLQPLSLEDTWLAVGWSTEILPLLKRERELAGVVPQSGTLLTADLWVSPADAPARNADRLEVLKQWIGFYWTPQTAAQLALLTSMASPLFSYGVSAINSVPSSLKFKDLLLPPADVQQRSELLKPLPAPTLEQYRRLWISVRQG
ncbi:extracellular solute-binding protein [Phormidium tenue FACHB-886]|nr:extracellular solute-binding protein [Phormidium tenue FACHB-886]